MVSMNDTWFTTMLDVGVVVGIVYMALLAALFAVCLICEVAAVVGDRLRARTPWTPARVEGSAPTGVAMRTVGGVLEVRYTEANDTDDRRRPSGARVEAFRHGVMLERLEGGERPLLLPGASVTMTERFDLRDGGGDGIRLMGV